MNQLRALLLTGPAELREQLRGLTPGTLIDTCAGCCQCANATRLVAESRSSQDRKTPHGGVSLDVLGEFAPSR
jgi:hypothetical protein